LQQSGALPGQSALPEQTAMVQAAGAVHEALLVVGETQQSCAPGQGLESTQETVTPPVGHWLLAAMQLNAPAIDTQQDSRPDRHAVAPQGINVPVSPPDPPFCPPVPPAAPDEPPSAPGSGPTRLVSISVRPQPDVHGTASRAAVKAAAATRDRADVFMCGGLER
jgi:hypothetical protein